MAECLAYCVLILLRMYSSLRICIYVRIVLMNVTGTGISACLLYMLAVNILTWYTYVQARALG